MTKIMNLYPLPDLPGEYNNYTRNAASYDNEDNYDGRVDWDPTEKDVVFFRYSYSNRDRFIPGFFGGIADGTPTSAWGRQILLSHSGVFGFTHIFTPTPDERVSLRLRAQLLLRPAGSLRKESGRRVRARRPREPTGRRRYIPNLLRHRRAL